MKITGKLIYGYGVIAIMVCLVGFFGLTATRQIVKSFEGGEEQIRAIVASANEVSGFVKGAESHLILYLTLNDEADKEKYFKRLDSLQKEISFLYEKVEIPEARRILDKINIETIKLAPINDSLFLAYKTDIRKNKRFDFGLHKELIEQFHNVISIIREHGTDLADFETDFLNRQEAISAANELSGNAKRAESHVMLYLALHDEKNKVLYLERIKSLQKQTAELDRNVTDVKARIILDKIKSKIEQFISSGDVLLKTYESDMQKTGIFKFDHYRELVRNLNEVASEIQQHGIDLADLNLYLETKPKELAMKNALVLQRNIIVAVIIAFIISLSLGYFISKAISNPIIKLKKAAMEIGRGKLEANIEIKSRDEIEDLANSFKKMTEDLQKTTVSKDYVHNIIGSMIDSLIVVDPDAKIRMVNEATCKLLGFQEEELIGKSIETIFDATEEISTQEKVLDKLIDEGKVNNYKTYLKAQDGKKIPILFNGSVVKDKDGRIIRIVCTARDISELKQIENERERLIEELQEALAEVKQLSGLLPICASCKKIRDDKGYWNQIEEYILDHSEAEFSHSICPDCMKKLYPDV
jgi:PAS domain S-box-containing protein